MNSNNEPSRIEMGTHPFPSVTLPCGPEDFTSFIAGLLGRPQTRRRTLLFSYNLERDDIIDICHLIDQRISLQNAGELVSASIRIDYEDASSITLNDLKGFETYRDITNIMPVYCDISLIYLLNFPKKDAPEKQTINISFDTRNNIKKRKSQEIYIWPTYLGSINIEIHHTDRSFGIDIDRLLLDRLQKLQSEIAPENDFITMYKSYITGSSVTLFLLGSFFACYYYINFTTSKWKFDYNLITNNGDMSQYMIAKVDFVNAIILGGLMSDIPMIIIAWIFASLVLSIDLALFLDDSMTFNYDSFILFNESSLSKKKKYDQNYHY